MESLDDCVLGETDTELRITTSAENRAAAVAMVRQGLRTALIFSHDLDPRVYDNPELAQAVSELARRSKYSWVRVLVQDTATIVRDGHRLVEVARRLSSRVEIRQAHPDFAQVHRAFVVVDGVGLILRPVGDRYDGTANFHAPMAAREEAHLFRRVWDRSAPAPDLRRLHV